MTDPVGRVAGKYATTPGGKPTAPSVTAVCGVLDKPGLAPGAVKECAHFLFNHPDEARVPDGHALSARLIRHYKGAWLAKAARGTLVHDVNAAWVEGREADITDPEALPYVDALERFWTDWQPEWLHVERTVVYDHPDVGYGGTFDWIARLCDGRVVLGDIKTGKAVYPEVRWQLAAYRYAKAMAVYDELGQFTGTEPMPEVDGCAVLHLKDDGTYRLLDVPVGRQEFDEFLHLRRAWSVAQRKVTLGKTLSAPQLEGAA